MKGVHLKIVILLAVLGIGISTTHAILGAENKLYQTRLKDFPERIEDWRLIKSHSLDQRTLEILKVDDYTMRDYADREGNVISLYIGYFQAQRQGKVIHSPRQCLPGSGWNPLSTEIIEISVPNMGISNSFKINKMLMIKGSERQWFLFWYQGRGRIYADEFLNKIYLILDGTVKRRTDGALIRVNCNSEPDASAALERQKRFVRSIFPYIRSYIPG
jgi:EpsI family protein